MTPTKCELDKLADEAISLMCQHVMEYAATRDITISKWFWQEESHRRVIRAYIQTELAWGNR